MSRGLTPRRFTGGTHRDRVDLARIKLHREGVELHQASGLEVGPDPRLDCLGGLKTTDDPWEHPEDANRREDRTRPAETPRGTRLAGRRRERPGVSRRRGAAAGDLYVRGSCAD